MKYDWTLDEVLAFLEDTPELSWEIRCLRGIKEWALAQQPVGIGDRCRIAPGFVVDRYREPGWWPSRDCLAAGAACEVVAVEWNQVYGLWHAVIVLDDEWLISPNGERIPTEHRHRFALRIDQVELAQKAEVRTQNGDQSG